MSEIIHGSYGVISEQYLITFPRGEIALIDNSTAKDRRKSIVGAVQCSGYRKSQKVKEFALSLLRQINMPDTAACLNFLHLAIAWNNSCEFIYLFFIPSRIRH
jgi:hypothetical protein